MADEKNTEKTQRIQRDRAEESSGLGTLATSSFAADVQEDNKSMKVAWIGALIFHFLLFVTVFPEVGGTMETEEKRDTVVIKRYKPPEPPKEQPKKKIRKKKTAKVPIPDPTPDEPEPIVAEEVEFVDTELADTEAEFVVGGPPSGPPVKEPQGPMRVGGEIQQPERIHHVNPVYPELARRARLEGTVILQAIIDRQGNVKDAEVLRNLGLGLDEAAVEAVQQWKYSPTYYNGRPVEVILTVTVQFELVQ